MLKSKKYYVNKYIESVEEGRREHIKENGNDNNYDSMEYIETVDEIVGYYIDTYNDEALETWINNLNYGIGHKTDGDVTRILKQLS